MSLRRKRIVFRCVIAGALFALTYNAHIPALEYVWARIMSYYPGYPNVVFAKGVYYSEENHNFDYPYMNIACFTKSMPHYLFHSRHGSYGALALVYTTRCTYFQVWAMIVPFFVTRRKVWSVIKAVLIAGLFASSMNLVRLTLTTALVYEDVPWRHAHDLLNMVLGFDTIGLSIVYYLRTLRTAEAEEGQKAKGSLSAPRSAEQVAADVSMQTPDPHPAWE